MIRNQAPDGHTMSRSRRWLRRLALVCTAGPLLLVAAEFVLRAFGYAPIYRIYSHPEIFWRKDELLGWSQQSNVDGLYVGPRPWPVEYRGTVHINSLGLRGPEIAELPPDGYRVMILGDSMVAGFELPWEKTFPALLEARLNDEFDIPVQVINAGVRAYGPDQSFLYYQRRGRGLRPNLVVLIFGGNDYTDVVTLHRMRRTFGKGAFKLRPDGNLELVGYPIPDYPICSEWILDAKFRPVRVDTVPERVMCTVQTQLSDRSALFTLISMRIREYPALLSFLYKLGSPSAGAEASVLGFLAARKPHRQDIAPGDVLVTALVYALAREVRNNGAELLLSRMDAGELYPNAEADGLFSFAVAESIAPEYHFVRDSHWNERGHALMARLLAEPIAERIRAHIARANAG